MLGCGCLVVMISSIVSGSVVVTSDDVIVVLEDVPMLIDDSLELAVVSETPGNDSWLVVGGGAVDEIESATGVPCEVTTTSTGSLWSLSLASLADSLPLEMVVISFSIAWVDESSELTSTGEIGMAVVAANGSSDSLTGSLAAGVVVVVDVNNSVTFCAMVDSADASVVASSTGATVVIDSELIALGTVVTLSESSSTVELALESEEGEDEGDELGDSVEVELNSSSTLTGAVVVCFSSCKSDKVVDEVPCEVPSSPATVDEDAISGTLVLVVVT